MSNPEASTDDDSLECVVDEKKAVSPLAVPDLTNAGDRRRNNPKVVFPADAIDFERSGIILNWYGRNIGISRLQTRTEWILNKRERDDDGDDDVRMDFSRKAG